MKLHTHTLAGIVLVLFLLCSCSARLTPFTQELYDKHRWSDSELQHIQFYLSEDVILRRQLSRGESHITKGKIVLDDGRRIEEIRIPAYTPGVLLFKPREDRFAVSFESGGEDLYLMFGPNPKNRNRYALLAREWEGNQGKVSYNGNVYDVDARSGLASLMVDLRRKGKLQHQTRNVQGRRIQ